MELFINFKEHDSRDDFYLYEEARMEIFLTDSFLKISIFNPNWEIYNEHFNWILKAYNCYELPY